MTTIKLLLQHRHIAKDLFLMSALFSFNAQDDKWHPYLVLGFCSSMLSRCEGLCFLLGRREDLITQRLLLNYIMLGIMPWQAFQICIRNRAAHCREPSSDLAYTNH